MTEDDFEYWDTSENDVLDELKCEHKTRESRNGLLEDYDKCTDCGLEIPHDFPKQSNF